MTSLSQADVPGTPRPVSQAAINRILAGLGCILAFLLLNPFLALILLAVVSYYQRIPLTVFVLCASISFTLFFYFREYGVEWYPDSTDDVPQYIAMYQSNYGFSLGDILLRFNRAPNGGEPFWHIPWWLLLTFLNASDNTFVFLHYYVILLSLFLSFVVLSRRYAIAFAVVYFFLTPGTLDAVAHIWRQQLAFTMFFAGIAFQMSRGSRIGKWLIYGSILMHLSCLLFCAIYFVAEMIRKRNGFKNKIVTSMVLLVIIVGLPALCTAIIFFLDSLGLARIMAYFQGYGTDTFRIYLIMAVYAVPMLASVYLLRNDDMNNLFMVLSFAVFAIVLALPGANSIYDRLLMFILPLWGLYFFRLLQMNFSARWQVPILILVFIIGAARLHAPMAEASGVANFLAYGNSFDLFMGTFKMLSTY